jgi:hypothetical protein
MLGRSLLAPRRKNAPRPAEKDARGFLQWVRGRACLFAHMSGCSGKIEAAHLDFAGGKGVGTKVADRYAIPACQGHHRLQHDKGWTTFMALMGTNAKELLGAAARLWNAWPGRRAWERKQGQ